MTITSLEYDEFYLRLDLVPGDPPERIELSFKRLITIYHPDVCTILGKKEAHERTIALKAAREALAGYWKEHRKAPPSHRQEQKEKAEELRKQEAERRQREQQEQQRKQQELERQRQKQELERQKQWHDAEPPANRIESLSATVVALKTFASGFQPPPLESRIYSSWFAREVAEYVNWELHLSYPSARTGAVLHIQEVWHAPDGQVINECGLEIKLPPGTEYYYWHGFGRSGAGAFANGQHRIDLFVQRIKIASKTFTVYPVRLGVPADIESIQAKVTSLSFFAAAPDGNIPQQKTFASRFLGSHGLTLYWQLDLSHPVQGIQRDFTIQALCYNQAGVLVSTQDVRTYVQGDWTGSFHCGKLSALGSFGEYRVALLSDGQQVAGGRFTIDPPQVPNLKVTVSAVKFFEGTLSNWQQSLPANVFRQSTTRWIFWQIEFIREYAHIELTVDLEVFWYGPAGLVCQTPIRAILPVGNFNPGWYVSWGRDLPGWFAAGSYRVDTYQAGRLLRSDSFQIVW